MGELRDISKPINIYERKSLEGNECWYCGDPLYYKHKTKNHFYPKSKGGKLTVSCCSRCNKIKGNRTPIEFIALIKNCFKKNYSKEHIIQERYDRMIEAIELLWGSVKWSLKNK